MEVSDIIMDDIISRQAAIDAMKGIGRLATLPDNDDVVRMSAVEYVLFNLPSAQPEITRCKDCVDYQTDWIPETAPDRHYCATMDSFMPEDGFCNYAERRTDG